MATKPKKSTKEYSNIPKIEEFKTNQVEQEDLFLIVNKDGKYLIALTNKIVSKQQFETLEEARAYVQSKPWELILNATAVMMNYLQHPEEIKL